MADQPSDEEIARWQRRIAVDSNNRGWQLAELAERTPSQTDEMVHAAHASALLWRRIGTDLNAARAHMLLGQAHGLAGDGALALRYAKASFDYFTAHECPDWEIAFAHAAMACAAHAAGEQALHDVHYREAKRLGEVIAEAEDRVVFMKTFCRIPSPKQAPD